MDPFTIVVSAVVDASENPLEAWFFGPHARAIRVTIFLAGTAVLIAMVLVALRRLRARVLRRLAEEAPPVHAGATDAVPTLTASDELVH